jgi:putative ABC transport system permease protein
LSFLKLLISNVTGSSFRSWSVLACVLFLAAFSVTTTLIIRGAQGNLELAEQRLGADIVVAPEGAEARIESALLMGKPAPYWMPADKVQSIAAIQGVAVASPQLYLASLSDSPYSTGSELHLVAYDQETDFTLRPWMGRQLERRLGLGEAIGGSAVSVPAGSEKISVFGYDLTLVGNLEPTGTELDHTAFFTFETARDLIALTQGQIGQSPEVPANSISAVMVQIRPGLNPDSVALEIIQQVSGTTPFANLTLYRSLQQQIGQIVQSYLVVLAIVWAIALLISGLIFSIAANERRREIAVLRVLGSNRGFVLRSLLAEATLLALAGGVAGVALAAAAVYLLRDLIATFLEMAFVFPSVSELLVLVSGGLILAVATVTIAALYPAIRLTRQDPALAMRE